MLTTLAPWIAAAGAWLAAGIAITRLFLVERRRVGIDERTSDAQLRAEALRLLMEITGSRDMEIARLNAENAELRLLKDDTLHEQECCRLLIENLRSVTSEDWATATRHQVDFLKRRGLAHELEGIEFPWDMEIRL